MLLNSLLRRFGSKRGKRGAKALKIRYNKVVYTRGLLVILWFNCDIEKYHFEFSRLNSGRRRLVVLICLQCVPSLFVFFPNLVVS